MNNSKEKLEFIDFVLSISDNDLPVDKSVQIDFVNYRLNEIEECLEERLDIIEKKINTMMKYIDSIKK
jgi:chaperonin cofactor prefoldin